MRGDLVLAERFSFTVTELVAHSKSPKLLSPIDVFTAGADNKDNTAGPSSLNAYGPVFLLWALPYFISTLIPSLIEASLSSLPF